jgi:hypothetical protein
MLNKIYRISANLCLLHAILVTAGLLLVWLVRSFTVTQQTFAHELERPWVLAVMLWPFWWVICLATARGQLRRAVRALLVCTAVWLPPATLLLWVAYVIGSFDPYLRSLHLR